MSAVHQGWGTRQIEDACRLWRRIWLLAGGTPASIRRGCDAFRLGICRENGGEMPCQCRHWFNIPHRKRAMLIAVSAGMPYGLIAFVSGEPPQQVAVQVDLRLCETVPAQGAGRENHGACADVVQPHRRRAVERKDPRKLSVNERSMHASAARLRSAFMLPYADNPVLARVVAGRKRLAV